MILELIRLRLKQGIRLIRSTGIVLILLTMLSIFGVAATFLSNVIGWSPLWIVLAVTCICIAVNLYRQDWEFLKYIASSSNHIRLLIFIEYVLCVVPLLIIQLYFGNYLVVLYSILAIAVIACFYNIISIKKKTPSKKSINLIPEEMFELKFRIERQPILFILFFGLSGLGFLHPAFLVISLIATVLLFMEAYNPMEPPEMIHWRKYFVFHKIKNAMMFMIAIFILQGVVCYIFNPRFIGLILYAFVAVNTLLCLAISYKYSLYNPLFSRSSGSNILALFVLFSLLPGGILVSLPFAIMHYIKAERTMKLYYA